MMRAPNRDENGSPHQLSFDLHPYLSSIEAIADQHGLQHDSGVAFGSSGGSGSTITNKATSSASILPQSQPQQDESRGGRFLLAPSGSSGSLKRPSTSLPEGGDPRAKRIIESPGVTGEYDARSDAWSDVTRRLKPFGDTLRQERLRTALGETDLGKDCVGLLAYSITVSPDGDAIHEAQVEMLRILANLCIDHDVNREKLLCVGAPQTIASLLQELLRSPDLTTFGTLILTLLRTAAGALLNMQLDHPTTREALRQDPNTIEMLLKLATDERVYQLGVWYRPPPQQAVSETWKQSISTGVNAATWAWRIVQDVVSGDDDEENSSSAGNTKSDEEERPIESLVRIGRSMAANYLGQPFARLLDTTSGEGKTMKGAWSGDDVADMMESDMDIVQIASELIESCSLDSRQFRIAALDDLPRTKPFMDPYVAVDSLKTMLELLVTFLDVGEVPAAWKTERNETDDLPAKPSDAEAAKDVAGSFERAKAAIARAIVSIVGEDENMTTLFKGQGNGPGGWFTETMKEWMTRDPKSRDDLVSTAMLAVGNLARKDAHCVALVHDHVVVPTLTALLVPTADIKVNHGVVCLLKNLAIPARNKQVIGASNDLFARLTPFLDTGMDKVQPLQFATVGLLKHLCAGCVENACALVAKDTFTMLLNLIKRTDDVPTRMEGTRILVNAAKTLWSATAATGETGDAERQAARQKLTCEPVVLALSDMVKSSTKYPVLVNEGILALTLIASEQDAQRRPEGAQLVAKALQTFLPSRKTSGASAEDKRAAAAATAAKGSADGGEDQSIPRLPQRQTTLDALASTTTQALPVHRTGADMIGTVLSRGDARMPPQFANNACALVQALVQGGRQAQSHAEGDGAIDSDSIRSVLQAWLPALQQLSEVGPQETLPVAQRTLQRVKAFNAVVTPAPTAEA